MKLNDLILPFKESGIEWRIGQAGKTGAGGIWATCLAYVSARAIMHRLDEVCGPAGWKVEYSILPQGVICRLSIKCGDEWITKEDGAEQTEIESFKGGISSALKRAGSAWGIGRYLYDLDQGFATIVQKGAPGAKYGKLPDKAGGDPFHWVPPQLPDWALPSKEDKTPEPPEPQKPIGAWMNQPGKNDGSGAGGVPIKYGPLAGQFVHDADPAKLRDYILTEELKWKKRGLAEPPEWARPMVAAAEPIIAAWENSR